MHVHKRPWRQTEDDYLVKFDGRLPIKEMAKILGRSPNAVALRLTKLRKRNLARLEQTGYKHLKRKIPEHLRPAFYEFVCETIQENEDLQLILQDRYWKRINLQTKVV